MLSGNGRHRRPRQAPALIVAAGVTGSAIAIPLLGAASANAADGTTWDKVANCETGGSWSKNSGNGLYGGLQLSQADWDKHGGLDYAQRPDLASRNQQIAVAEKLLDAEGVGAFHTCGLTSGLTKDSGSAAVDTGVVGSLLGSSGSSGSSDGSGSTGLSNSSGDSAGGSSSTGGSPSPSTSPDSGGKSAKSGNSASPSASPSDVQSAGTPSTGRAKSDDSDNSQQAVGSWNLVDTGAVTSDTGGGRHRGPSADESRAAGATGGSYTVHAGDSLGSIADTLGLNGGWRALYDENKQALGGDPNHIAPGQTLRLPAE